METGQSAERLSEAAIRPATRKLFRSKSRLTLWIHRDFPRWIFRGWKRKICGGIIRNLKSMSQTAVLRACVISGEPDCGVKEAVEAGKISRLRYENYMQLYQELKNRRNIKKKGVREMNCLSPSILSADFQDWESRSVNWTRQGHSMYILMSWTECLCQVFPSGFR